MLIDRKKLIFCGRLATVFMFMGITYLALTTVETPVVDGWNDKFKHVLAFVVLSFNLIYLWGLNWVKVLFALLGYGGAIELVQFFIPGRFASGYDLLADVSGIGLGLLFAHFAARRLPLKRSYSNK